MFENLRLAIVRIILALFAAGAASSADASTNQVFVQAKDQYLLYVYPKTPYVSAGRTMVSFPYFFEALGGTRSTLKGTMSVNFARNTLAYDLRQNRFAINGDPLWVSVERDSSTGTVFVPLACVLNKLGLPYAFDQTRRTLNLWGADYFRNVLNSGAGTPFDNFTPTTQAVYPLQFELSKGAIGSVPTRPANPDARQGAPRERYNFIFRLPSNTFKFVQVMRLYTHFGDTTGYFQQTTLGVAPQGTRDADVAVCIPGQGVVRCDSGVEMYRLRPSDAMKNPVFYVLLKVNIQ